jgi:CHASE3 domain sensor protein
MSLHNINGSNYGDHHQESEINIWKQKNNLKLGKVVPIGLGAIAVLNLLMAGMSQYSINRIKTSIELVETAQIIKADLRLLEKQLLDAETGQRGFIYTNDPNYLEPYERSLESMGDTFAELTQLIIDPVQLNRLEIVEELSKNKLDELAQTIELKRNGKEAEVKALVTSNIGKEAMDDIREKLVELEDSRRLKLLMSGEPSSPRLNNRRI